MFAQDDYVNFQGYDGFAACVGQLKTTNGNLYLYFPQSLNGAPYVTIMLGIAFNTLGQNVDFTADGVLLRKIDYYEFKNLQRKLRGNNPIVILP